MRTAPDLIAVHYYELRLDAYQMQAIRIQISSNCSVERWFQTFRILPAVHKMENVWNEKKRQRIRKKKKSCLKTTVLNKNWPGIFEWNGNAMTWCHNDVRPTIETPSQHGNENKLWSLRCFIHLHIVLHNMDDFFFTSHSVAIEDGHLHDYLVTENLNTEKKQNNSPSLCNMLKSKKKA